MRTIKFRGLTESGKLLVGDLCHVNGKVYVFTREGKNVYNSPDFYEVRPGTVGQFTGLKDKNGVEIYDGDILKYNTYPKKLIVEYKEGNAQFLCGLSTDFWDRAEVIGNIHQHSELLK